MSLPRAKKALGQNFLVNEGVRNAIISALAPEPREAIVEIGPGPGALTAHLAQRAHRLVAIEKDPALSHDLAATFINAPSVRIETADVLTWDPRQALHKNEAYSVVGNIPYNITGAILRTVLETWPRPRTIVFMVQKEVAERMMAQPPHMNILAVCTQLFATISRVMNVAPGSFRPAPRVFSSVIQLTPHAERPHDGICAFVRAGFAHPRKHLAAVLGEHLSLPRSTVEQHLATIQKTAASRAQELSCEDWKTLFSSLQIS
ncbi:MAG: 16S rRNA (adenine(1518)-N(6)/adenine(1519)-N(6))-dimethyltransferase RsmA [Patescibacteria group bacterium]